MTPQSGRVTIRDRMFHRNQDRFKFWGVNLSFGANFPSQEDAPVVAARMASVGVNSVRLHHMDTSNWPRGIWDRENTTDFHPEAIKRLDYFIHQLALKGIFINLNLHVGREHSRYLGLPKVNRQYDKITGMFTPKIIDAQKGFARRILERVNPHRKVRYADDPAIAVVEISNENSFFMWDSERTLRELPGYYADLLNEQYNDWLRTRYGSDPKLRQAWNRGVRPEGSNLLMNPSFKFAQETISKPENWGVGTTSILQGHPAPIFVP